jgi:hypothetical protein
MAVQIVYSLNGALSSSPPSVTKRQGQLKPRVALETMVECAYFISSKWDVSGVLEAEKCQDLIHTFKKRSKTWVVHKVGTC